MDVEADERLPVQRAAYRPPGLQLEHVELEFDLALPATTVRAELKLRRDGAARFEPLWLDGERLELLSARLDGLPLEAPALRVEARGVWIDTGGAERFVLEIRTRIAPGANTDLLGLYASRHLLLTQCEAQGFRRITYFPDRPDVLAPYRVRLQADPGRFPILLSNGNLVEEGPLADGRHFATWVDPHPKPSYLFALVAGPLQCRQWSVTVGGAAGRAVLLQLWAAAADLPRLAHAAASLEQAIAWDSRRFGLELDLDQYMIVAVRDFNFGAMENKGLNIFSTRFVLADPDIATDADYAEVEATVAHEYFHNWTGNRVTCRDWFQLCLKEGLTVYREQEYVLERLAQASADPRWARSAACVPRIDAIRMLRTVQFAEDAGPMAHAVRPDSYLAINNFYTSTVYRKGAELIRMMATLVGAAAFRRGFDLFIARHDGRAATCEDFVDAIGAGASRDLRPFMRWYSQAGTPRLAVRSIHDPATDTIELSFVQSCAPTPGHPRKEPLMIPVEVGLVAPDGSAVPLRDDPQDPGLASRVLVLSEPVHSFRFHGVPVGTVPSLLRNFSAPVQVDYPYDESQLSLLALHDTDPCNRWDALQRLVSLRLAAMTDALESEGRAELDEATIGLMREILLDESLAPSFRELALRLPAESLLADARAVVVPEAIHQARVIAQQALARRLHPQWLATYLALGDTTPYRPDPDASGRRALKNLALELLVAGGGTQAMALAHQQLVGADNLTDRFAALATLVNSASPSKADWLLKFARDGQAEPLLMNKWFRVQATAMRHPGEPPVLDRVRALLRHGAYSDRDPQAVEALVLGYCAENPAEFHRVDGSGYAFWVEQVRRLDPINPIMAARVARCLERWRRFVPDRREPMRLALQEVARGPSLSPDVREVIDRALQG